MRDKVVRTTISDSKAACPLDRVNRQFRDFVLDALEQALYARQPEQGNSLVHHSDRGSQYVSIRYSERLAKAGVEPSVGSKGDSYDNALATLEWVA